MTEPTLEPGSYAWNWFALHSGQRMQLVNFWVVAVAFLVSAFVQARANDLIFVSIGVSAAGAGTSVAFLLLDRRTRELIHAAEAALRRIEESWEATEPTSNNGLVRSAGQHQSGRLASYYPVIQGIQTIIACLFVIAGIQAAFV